MFRVFLFLFFVYLLTGSVTVAILYSRWQRIKGFKQDFVSILVGIFCWPLIIRVVRKPQDLVSKKDSLKQRIATMVDGDRSKGGIKDWVNNYITNPKIDREEVYQSPPGRR